MSNPVDHLRDFLGSACRSCSFLNGWICSLISRCPILVSGNILYFFGKRVVGCKCLCSVGQVATLIISYHSLGFLLGICFLLQPRRKKINFSTVMAAMNAIYISSSDSELEIEDVDRNTSSLRVLPEWAAIYGTNSRSSG